MDLLVDSTKALALIKLLPKHKENGLKNGMLKFLFTYSFSGDIRLISLDFYGSSEIVLPIKQQNKANYEMYFII